MIFDSMAAIQADGVSMREAHPDLEVFRLHLGKAINTSSARTPRPASSRGKIPGKVRLLVLAYQSTRILSDFPQVALLLTLKEVLQATT